jgi:hypothetical protein
MRLWSLHPKYLDAKGLVVLWREALLAKHVLEGKTQGYKNHPQLIRFKNCKQPVKAINQYLSIVLSESVARGYKFDESKVNLKVSPVRLHVTSGQIDYERKHLLKKLKVRDIDKYKQLKSTKPVLSSANVSFDAHPLFKIVDGAIEAWEIVQKF